jgi:hypothetical protein
MSNVLPAQTDQIIRRLAQIQGSVSLRVVTRRFPRFGPAELGTGFHQSQFEIACGQVPPAIKLPPDADEIRITLQGALDSGMARPQLKQAVCAAIAGPTLPAVWDFRVHFSNQTDGNSSYQVNVSSDIGASHSVLPG